MPFEVPESWCWTTIEAICSKIGSGSTPRGSNYSPSGIPFFRSQNVYDYSLCFDDIKFISRDIHQSMIGTEVLPNDVLLNITGGSLGRCAVVPPIFNVGNVSQHVCILRPILILPKYLHAFLLSGYFHKSMEVTGSGREGLPKYSIEKMLFPLPPIDEQKRIIDKIGNMMLAIDIFKSASEELELTISRLKEKTLELAISGKLIRQNPADEPAIELLKRITPGYKPTDNRHYENVELSIPETWCWATVGDVFNHNTGKALNSSNHSGIMMDYITTSNLYWDRFDLSIVKQMPFTEKDLEKCTVTKGDLLICEGGDVGRSAIWNYNYDIRIQNHIHRLRGKANICVRYFFYVFMLYKQRNYIGGKGVAIQGLSSRDLNRLVIPLPPLNEQYRIAKSVDNLFSTIDNILLEL